MKTAVDVERYGNAKFDWRRTFFPFKNGILRTILSDVVLVGPIP
jgi:hypothetical protein